MQLHKITTFAYGVILQLLDWTMRQINSDKTLRWKDDTRQSVCFYNDWFMAYAPPSLHRGEESGCA